MPLRGEDIADACVGMTFPYPTNADAVGQLLVEDSGVQGARVMRSSRLVNPPVFDDPYSTVRAHADSQYRAASMMQQDYRRWRQADDWWTPRTASSLQRDPDPDAWQALYFEAPNPAAALSAHPATHASNPTGNGRQPEADALHRQRHWHRAGLETETPYAKVRRLSGTIPMQALLREVATCLLSCVGRCEQLAFVGRCVSPGSLAWLRAEDLRLATVLKCFANDLHMEALGEGKWHDHYLHTTLKQRYSYYSPCRRQGPHA
eukprot:TRINITY_DN15049_c0_g2_i1.p1 TRINITY_DN15049_c0_g2~~TRINITY_DN15049_c0_g2_i1.p1  ORF type:complete len:262 (+),score=18.88 TRINITY_DN15049_c0_g2_i1:99-884(+)